MALDSKYFDSIRIRSGSKAKAEKPDVPECQWEGCDKPGTHKAPAGRGHEGQYLHFCIEHVREYNKNFNYFSGLTPEQISKFQKDAIVGHRPTWKASSSSNGSAESTARASAEFSRVRSGSAASLNRTRDPYHLFNERRAAVPKQRKLKTLEAKAFMTLGLDISATGNDIKIKYKELIKMHHPDANGGDRSSEDRFRDVLKAYNLLKSAGFC